MTRRFFPAALLGALLACGPSVVLGGDGLIPHPMAGQHGLTRAWFTQVQLDQSRGRLMHALLHNGTLFIQTDQAVLHAINAENGATLWSEEVGNRKYPSLAPAANDELVAVVNGSRLYVLNRFSGKLLWQTTVDGAPGAGPALSSQRAYVPTVNGLVYSYRLKPVVNPMQELGKTVAKTPDQEVAEVAERRQALRLQQAYIPPLACQSTGRAIVQPLVTRQQAGEEFLAWPTDRGYLFVGQINRTNENRFTVRYRLQTNAEIVAQPAYLPPDPKVVGDSGMIYAVSKDGFVHAVRERDGESMWRFPTGEPIVQPAVVVVDRVYAATQPGGLYCLDAKTGKQVWWTPQIGQFVAASKDRVYAADKSGQMLILDAKNGARLDTIPATGPLLKLTNTETDRIYLATETGLIQCLHETEQSDPIRYLQPSEKNSSAEATKSAGEKNGTPEEGEKPAEEKKTAKPPSSGGGGGFKPTPKKTPKKKAGEFGDEKPAKTKKSGKAGSPAGMGEGFGSGGGKKGSKKGAKMPPGAPMGMGMGMEGMVQPGIQPPAQGKAKKKGGF